MYSKDVYQNNLTAESFLIKFRRKHTLNWCTIIRLTKTEETFQKNRKIILKKSVLEMEFYKQKSAETVQNELQGKQQK